MTNRKKLLLILSILLGLNTNALMAELTQTQLHATLGIVTNFVLDDNTIYHHGIEYKIVISPYTGKQWLDRNLGASQVCTSFDDPLCFGDYYQWGRDADGHQESNSSTTATLATDVNNVGTSSFIIGSQDWASVDSSGAIRLANWSKTDGSSVCPVGFRVPTLGDMQAELFVSGSASITDSASAFNNFLRLPSAGIRMNSILTLAGQVGLIWIANFSAVVLFDNSDASITAPSDHIVGMPVRCVKGPISPDIPLV